MQSAEIEEIVSNYGTVLYHNTTIRSNFSLKNMFSYSSNEYEKAIEGTSELELPNFYVENVNEQNQQHVDLKSINANVVSKEYINTISSQQDGLNARSSEQILKFKNILFGDSFVSSRSNSNLSELPYHNTIRVVSAGIDKLTNTLRDIRFKEEILGAILSEQQSLEVSFEVEGQTINVPSKISLTHYLTTL